MKYSEKLKDPRWQKKRLEILNRDEWACQNCFDTEKTLTVHHLHYLVNKEPWEYDESLLITLCKDCHETEYEMMPAAEADIVTIIKSRGFLSEDFNEISAGFIALDSKYPHDVTASIICFALSDRDTFSKLEKMYFSALRRKNEGEK